MCLKQSEGFLVMACIIKKIKKGRTYYYAVQSGRVDGKPRIIWQKYLGTLDDIVKRKDDTSESSIKEADIFEAGGVAAMLRIADQIQLVDIIDKVIPKKGGGPSVGQYILLAAINRILAPCSKQQMPEWYEKTILFRLWKYSKESFNSQRFWDHMDLISEDHINLIQEQIVNYMITGFKINPGVILYDTTNFFTYIATNNNRNTIAQRGRQKQKRNDLRQVGLALLVSKEFQIPLFHRSYQGNQVDQKLFPKMSEEMIKSYKSVFTSLGKSQSTLVYDKGNISEDGQEELILSKQHFICAVPKYTIPEIFGITIDKLKPVEDISGTKALSFDVQIWNKKLKAVLVYSESLLLDQLTDLLQTIQKCEKKLHDLNQNYSKWEKKPDHKNCPTLQSAKKAVTSILGGEYISEIISAKVVKKANVPHVCYSIDQNKLDYINKHQLGRTLLITSRSEWSESEIISTYRGLNRIENGFKHMKNKDYLHWQPAFHWTDQKIKVHGLYCVLAMLLATLAHKKVVEKGVEISILEMIEDLGNIREVAVIYSGEANQKRKNEMTISKMSSRQKKLAEILEIGLYNVGGNTKKMPQETVA